MHRIFINLSIHLQCIYTHMFVLFIDVGIKKFKSHWFGQWCIGLACLLKYFRFYLPDISFDWTSFNLLKSCVVTWIAITPLHVPLYKYLLSHTCLYILYLSTMVLFIINPGYLNTTDSTDYICFLLCRMPLT